MIPTKIDPTGTGKRCRNGFRQAVRKQHKGIVIKPRMNAPEAMRTFTPERSSAFTLRAKSMLMNPRPQNEICPKRVIRLRKEEYPPIHSSRWKNKPMIAPLIAPASIAIHPARRLGAAISMVTSSGGFGRHPNKSGRLSRVRRKASFFRHSAIWA